MVGSDVNRFTKRIYWFSIGIFHFNIFHSVPNGFRFFIDINWYLTRCVRGVSRTHYDPVLFKLPAYVPWCKWVCIVSSYSLMNRYLRAASFIFFTMPFYDRIDLQSSETIIIKIVKLFFFTCQSSNVLCCRFARIRISGVVVGHDSSLWTLKNQNAIIWLLFEEC